MPNTKSSDIRYKVLDRYLRRGGYSTKNSDIDLSKSIEEIDRQLYKKYGPDQTEIYFIEKMINP